MKKIILGFSILLVAAGCNQQTAYQAPVQPTSSKPSTQTYVVTAGIKYVNDHPQETHFSIFTTDGSLLKTINIPTNFVFGAAGNAKVFGDKIYYRRGTIQ